MNQQLVKSLLVEIDASTEKLRRELRRGETELQGFAQKSERAGKVGATAADATATKQANAARTIAMTTETIARQGKVSGETAKQLLAQGSNMAFMFGPTGAIVGAVGIATLAIATMFNRTKREMQDTIDKGREAANQFAEMDAVGQARALNALVSGRRSDSAVLSTAQIMERPEEQRDELLRQRGISRLRADEARLLAEAREAATQAPNYLRSQARVAEIAAVRAALATLNDELVRNTAELSENAAAEATRNQDGLRRTAQTKAEQDAERERTEAAKQALQNRQAMARAAAAAEIQLDQKLQEHLRTGFKGTREDIERSFTELVEWAESTGQQSEVPILRNARDQAIELLTLLEQSDALLGNLAGKDLSERIARSDAQALGGAAGEDAAALRQLRDGWRAIANDQARSATERENAMKETLRMQAALEGLVAKESAERERARDALVAQAQLVGQMLDGVLQMAGAWGGVRREVLDVLRGVVQIGANVPNLLSKLDALDTAKAAALLGKGGKAGVVGAAASVAGAALPIIGALATIGGQLFGNSPAEQERKRVQQENTRAIERLTKQVGLSINVSGADWVSTRTELEKLMAGEMRAQNWTRLSSDALRRLGGVGGAEDAIGSGRRFRLSDFSDSARLDWKQLGDIDRDLLEQTARELDVTLDGTVGSFRRLIDAIAAAEGKLFEFSDSYEDQSTLTDLTIQAKQITDPIERTIAKLGPALEKSPILNQLLAGGDLSTAEGRAAMRDSILEILATMDSGGDALDASQVGLTRDQFLEVLGGLLSSLDDLDTQAAGAAGSSLGGVSGFRGLTEAAGERMADYLRGILGQGSEHLQVLRAQLTELTRIAATPFTLPAIPGVTVPAVAGGAGAAFAAGAVSVSIGDIVIELNGGGATDPAALGLLVRQGLQADVEEVLYRSLARALRARGDVSVIPGVR